MLSSLRSSVRDPVGRFLDDVVEALPWILLIVGIYTCKVHPADVVHCGFGPAPVSEEDR